MNTFCTACGKAFDYSAKFCAQCGSSSTSLTALPPPPPIPTPTMSTAFWQDELVLKQDLMRDMTNDQRLFFQGEVNRLRKSPKKAFWLAFCLGGGGAHHFYLGNTGRAVLYLCFCWTTIPSFVAFGELFGIKRYGTADEQSSCLPDCHANEGRPGGIILYGR